MLSLVVALVVLAPDIPPECQPPPLRDVAALTTFAQSSGSLSVGLDSVATWCFDSGGTWTAGETPAKGKTVAPTAAPNGDCRKAVISCEAARASVTPEQKLLLVDVLAELEKPFLGVKYKAKRSGLAERPPEVADCASRDRSTLFSHAQARMDLARLASQAQSEYANYRTWLYSEGLKCAQAVARGEKDYLQKRVAIDAPSQGGGTQQVPNSGGSGSTTTSVDGANTGTTSTGTTKTTTAGVTTGSTTVPTKATGTTAATTTAGTLKTDAGTTTAGTTTAGTTTAGTTTAGTTTAGTTTAGTTTAGTTTPGTKTAGTTTAGTTTAGTTTAGTTTAGTTTAGTTTAGTTTAGTTTAGTTTAGTTTAGTTTAGTTTAGTTAGTTTAGTTTAGTTTAGTTTAGTTTAGTTTAGTTTAGATTAGAKTAGTTTGTTTTTGSIGLGGPTAEREKALSGSMLDKWRYFAAEQSKIEGDVDWVAGFLASRELRDCRCQRPTPGDLVRRIENKDRIAQLEADDDKNTRCELCLLDVFPKWKSRATKQCALALELSDFELGVIQRSDDGNGLPPRCVDAAKQKQLAKQPPVLAAQTAKPANGGAYIITRAPDAAVELPAPPPSDFAKPTEYAPMPAREAGRVYVRVFTSSACIAEIFPGPVQARTGDLLPIPPSAKEITVRGPCGGFAEIYFGKEEKPRVAESFARNQPLRLQFKP